MKGILKAIGFFILYLMLTVLLQTLFSVLFMGIGAAAGIRDEKSIIEFANHNLLGITALSGLATVLLLYLVFKIRKKEIKAEWKLHPFQARELPLPLLLSFSYSFLFALATYGAPPENSALISASARYYSQTAPALGLLMMAVNLLLIAPVCEEVALRGIVYTRAEKTGRPAAAIAVSSLLFGCMHLSAGGGILALGSALMGAILGYIFCKYQSLWVCVLSHAAANLPDFILYRPYADARRFAFGA